MTPKIKIEEIISIISRKISVSDKDINENSKSTDFYKWDSLAQLIIILEIEKKINKKIDASMMGELTSVKSIIDYLKKLNVIS
jgi:acyl carrier protein